MMHRESAASSSTPKGVASLVILLLVLAAFFAFLNTQKIKALRATVVTAQAARDSAERRIREKLPGSGGTDVKEAQAKVAEAEKKAAKAETDLTQAQKEKADLQTKLDENQKQLASLQGAEETGRDPSGSTANNPAPAAAGDSQSQIDDLRRQLDGAEKEKAFLSQKLQDMQEHAGQPKEAKKKRETAREAVPRRTGLRGTVLAVNQAYNFVVLNLGNRHGVESNAEMLVLREGTLIGKIRISSVEPATAIGDIISNSLALGAQMQPGDSVIYAGTNP